MVSVSSVSSVSSKLELHGAAASSSPHSILYLPDNNNNSNNNNSKESLLYASNCILNIATPVTVTTGSTTTTTTTTNKASKTLLYNVQKTLRTQTIPRTEWIRSITALALLKDISLPENSCSTSTNSRNIVACAFSDGSITLWIQSDNEDDNDSNSDWNEIIVTGNTSTATINVNVIDESLSPAPAPTSIADIDGVYHIQPNGSMHFTLVTASAKGVQVYNHIHASKSASHHDPNTNTNTETNMIAKYPTSTVKFTMVDDHHQLLLAVGTALPRNNRIHFYTTPVNTHARANTHVHVIENVNVIGNENGSAQWKHQGSVMGHLDWISCLDWCMNTNKNMNMKMDSTSENEDPKENHDGFMLASGSQDARIRLWKFHPPTPMDQDGDDVESDDNDDSHSNSDSDSDNDGGTESEEDEEDLIEEGEARMHIRYKASNGIMVQIAITLEALLIGHEEPITSVQWRPRPPSASSSSSSSSSNHYHKPCLMTSSMDRSIFIWMEEDDETSQLATGTSTIVTEGTGNVWVPITRVGTAGGVLGGSVGSSLLGFVNVLWSGDGRQIVGHGFGGALYFWSCSGSGSGSGSGSDSGTTERWHAMPGITGHFRGCSDISWEATEGMYLLSGGLDQTCRMWMPLNLPAPTNQGGANSHSRIWKEVGRPQVHGYDINTVACIGAGTGTSENGGGELIHRFVSGADEKEARAFDAPIQTMELIQRITGDESAMIQDRELRVERAFIPSLGLSNRASPADAMEEGVEAGLTKLTSSAKNDEDGSATASASASPNEGGSGGKNDLESIAEVLPTERDLGVASLWPEIRKLYGHLTEMVCLASSAGRCKSMDAQGRVLVASSCKARDAENAAIRVWDVERTLCLDILKDGHKSTVVTLSFSSDGKFLASAGKDRKVCIWKRHETDVGETKYDLSAIVQSAHKRIIWSADFCPILDPSILATGSRDGFVKIWRVTEDTSNESGSLVKELYRFQPLCKGEKKVEPVTAIAFAPKAITIVCNVEEVNHAVIAIGMENGLIEIWAVPLDTKNGNDDNGDECRPQLLHSISVQDCHIGVVKKLAWRPLQKDDSTMVLASCSSDHGVRLYNILMN